MLSITYNILAQWFMSLFLYHLIKRIKNKTTYGSGSRSQINDQRNFELNPIEFNPNQVDNFNQRKDDLNNDNNHPINNKSIININLSFQIGNNRAERVDIISINNKNLKNNKTSHVKKN